MNLHQSQALERSMRLLYRSRRGLRRLLVASTLRKVAGPVYDAIIAQELAWQRLIDAIQRQRPESDSPLLDELTALVKTFQRPKALARLLRSIRRFYPQLRIIVVDDSRHPESLPGVEWIRLPYNSGVSAGRRAGLERVQTRYVMNLDDDFIFFRHTDLEAALNIMEAQPQVDIMGGDVIYLPFWSRIDYRTATIYPTQAQPTRPPGSDIGGLPVYDKVANFFIGRTERVRLVNWDPQLKVLDHADFFTRAKGVLTSVHNARLRCLHAKTPFDTGYMKHRGDPRLDVAILRRKYAGRQSGDTR